jgi:hypothetical protein
MSDLFCIRCVRCLWSITGTEPRDLAYGIGQHRCNPADERALAAFYAAAAWLDNKGDNQ